MKYRTGLTRRGLLAAHATAAAWRTPIEQHPDVQAALKAGATSDVDWTSACGPVRDQGQSSCCFAHAKSACQQGQAALNGTPLLFVPSPINIASCTYAMVRARSTPPSQTLAPLQDTGSTLEDAAAQDVWGMATMGVQITGRNGVSDVPDDPASNVFPEPDIRALIAAASKMMSGEYAIAIDDDAPQKLAACLQAKILVWDGFFCDSAYENADATAVSGAPDQSDPQGGGHSELYSAVRTTHENGQLVYQFFKQNSWGRMWRAGGGCWVDEAHVRAEWSLYPFAKAVS